MSPAVQWAIVALIVGVFAWRAFARFAPKAAWRLQAGLSFALETQRRVVLLQSLGRALRPREVRTGAGCGSGCSTCGGCATPGYEARTHAQHISTKNTTSSTSVA